MKIISWFSGGITSAVACKLAIDTYGANYVSLVYIETGSHHSDNLRFIKECESWYSKEIITIQNKKSYKDHFDVIKRERFINGPSGARCTTELKRRVREKFEKEYQPTHHVWGFEYDNKEQNRANRIQETIPNYKHIFPLIEHKITKIDCVNILQEAGIEVPMMYKLGFNNNNCIGCVKGGAAYWNLIRRHFPEVFEEMSKLERDLGRSCLRKYFLDELPVDAGRGTPPLVQECGSTGEGCYSQNSRNWYMRE